MKEQFGTISAKLAAVSAQIKLIGCYVEDQDIVADAIFGISDYLNGIISDLDAATDQLSRLELQKTVELIEADRKKAKA